MPEKALLKKSSGRQDGVALIILIWVMALLMIAATEFIYTLRVESAATESFKDETAAWGLALAGVNLGIAEVSVDYALVATGRDGVFFLKKEGGQVKKIEPSPRELELGEGKLVYSITDESGKLNINTASWETIEELLRLCGIEKTERDIIADSIIDWRDDGHEFHLNGAEDDYYGGLPKPYGAKDGPLDTVEELLLVKGMSPEAFYGEKLPAGYGRYSSYAGPGVFRFMTAKGSGKININTAPETVLEALLGKGRAGEIILKRQAEGFFDKPAYGADVSSSVFSIHSVGEARGLSYGIRAIVEKRHGMIRVSYWNEEGLNPE